MIKIGPVPSFHRSDSNQGFNDIANFFPLNFKFFCDKAEQSKTYIWRRTDISIQLKV